jgi:hypothetical protein
VIPQPFEKTLSLQAMLTLQLEEKGEPLVTQLPMENPRGLVLKILKGKIPL